MAGSKPFADADPKAQKKTTTSTKTSADMASTPRSDEHVKKRDALSLEESELYKAMTSGHITIRGLAFVGGVAVVVSGIIR